jgi:hypothetical protein
VQWNIAVSESIPGHLLMEDSVQATKTRNLKNIFQFFNWFIIWWSATLKSKCWLANRNQKCNEILQYSESIPGHLLMKDSVQATKTRNLKKNYSNSSIDS